MCVCAALMASNKRVAITHTPTRNVFSAVPQAVVVNISAYIERLMDFVTFMTLSQSMRFAVADIEYVWRQRYTRVFVYSSIAVLARLPARATDGKYLSLYQRAYAHMREYPISISISSNFTTEEASTIPETITSDCCNCTCYEQIDFVGTFTECDLYINYIISDIKKLHGSATWNGKINYTFFGNHFDKTYERLEDMKQPSKHSSLSAAYRFKEILERSRAFWNVTPYTFQIMTRALLRELNMSSAICYGNEQLHYIRSHVRNIPIPSDGRCLGCNFPIIIKSAVIKSEE